MSNMVLYGSGLQILGGSVPWRVVLRAYSLSTAIVIGVLLQMSSKSDLLSFSSVTTCECGLPSALDGEYLLNKRFFKPRSVKEEVNLTPSVVTELVGMQILNSSGKALYIGEEPVSTIYALKDLGFTKACRVQRRLLYSNKRKKFIHKLDYEDNAFDFVFSGDLDMASIPGILVHEIERVLKHGRVGAMLVGGYGIHPHSLTRSATSVLSQLKASTVVHVGPFNEFTLVVFKKRSDSVHLLEHFRLPADCKSVSSNRALLVNLEPVLETKKIGFEQRIAYLPKFVDMSSLKQLVYVNLGGVKFLPSYPVDPSSFEVYFVDHNTSPMLSHVVKPGLAYIYHGRHVSNTSIHKPGVEYISGEELLTWFRATMLYADFVVLKMKLGDVEFKFLTDLFRTGMLCFIDELFLECPDKVTTGNGAINIDCIDLFKVIRRNGVFVHQWWGD